MKAIIEVDGEKDIIDEAYHQMCIHFQSLEYDINFATHRLASKKEEIIAELREISKRIDYFMGRINHGASFHDNKAIQDWNNGNFGIKPLINKINNTINSERAI